MINFSLCYLPPCGIKLPTINAYVKIIKKEAVASSHMRDKVTLFGTSGNDMARIEINL